MAPIVWLALAAGGGYLWWKYKMPHALTVHTVDGGSYKTSFQVDGSMSDYQKQEALSNATTLMQGIQNGLYSPQEAAGQLRTQAKVYRDQGYSITAKSYEDSAASIEGGGFPTWFSEVPK